MVLMSSGIYDALSNHEQVNMRAEFEKIRGEFNTVKWMLGTMIVMMAGLYASIFANAINHATFR